VTVTVHINSKWGLPSYSFFGTNSNFLL